MNGGSSGDEATIAHRPTKRSVQLARLWTGKINSVALDRVGSVYPGYTLCILSCRAALHGYHIEFIVCFDYPVEYKTVRQTDTQWTAIAKLPLHSFGSDMPDFAYQTDIQIRSYYERERAAPRNEGDR